MNGSIQPTVELATNNGSGGFYPYPIYPMMMNGGNGGNGGFGFGGDSAIWLIVLLALIWGNNGNGNNGGIFGGGRGFDDGYAWLSNGQKEIMSNTNQGFDTLHLSNQVEGIRDDVNELQTAICNSTASINSNVSNGFFNAEIAENNRQIANMNQNFNNQLSLLSSLNSLNNRLSDCCCENRLATCQTQNIVQNEGNATRFADANNTRDIITNATANTQSILDKLCQLELDAKQDKIDEKNERIADLQRQLQMADLRASQTAQTALIREGQNREIDLMYQRLKDCPVGTIPVFGNQPIFTCSNNLNSGCGCNGFNTTSQFI